MFEAERYQCTLARPSLPETCQSHVGLALSSSTLSTCTDMTHVHKALARPSLPEACLRRVA